MSWGLEHLIDDLILCLSEAVSNAITHAAHGSTLPVRVSRADTCIRIEIEDGDRHPPVARSTRRNRTVRPQPPGPATRRPRTRPLPHRCASHPVGRTTTSYRQDRLARMRPRRARHSVTPMILRRPYPPPWYVAAEPQRTTSPTRTNHHVTAPWSRVIGVRSEFIRRWPS
ncbi:ATP-binding protein [Sphaerisporangium sp. NPDC051017]|uniref:ATP-binding protein n=1 Tax=Sphaerisporangium sp. NPDC051017 TaxID=3154636 RepID=UPI003449F1F2